MWVRSDSGSWVQVPTISQTQRGRLLNQLDVDALSSLVIRLQDENEHLQEQVRELQSEIARQNTQLGAFRLRHTSTLPSDVIRLFMSELFPTFRLNSSIGLGSNSPWCRATRLKKDLALVCRAWNDVAASHFLYKDVVIRRIPQLALLRRTLVSNPALGVMIKHLTLECFVPRRYWNVFCSDLKAIFVACPNITQVAPRFLVQEGQALRSDWIIPVFPARSLTHLNLWGCSSDGQAGMAGILMLNSESLVSLSIDATIQPTFTNLLELPRLRSLYLTNLDSTTQVSWDCWQMPQLQHLHLENWTVKMSQGLRRIHKPHIKSLFVNCSHLFPSSATLTAVVLEAIKGLTALEHLIFVPSRDYRIRDLAKQLITIKHPNIIWIDVCVRREDVRSSIWKDHLSGSDLPSLRRIRIVDNALTYASDPYDPPLAIPPDAPAPAHFLYDGLCTIRHDPGALYQVDGPMLSEDPYAEQDSAYYPTPDEDWCSEFGSDPDSEADSENGSSDLTDYEDGEETEEEWEADHDFVVQMHTATTDD